MNPERSRRKALSAAGLVLAVLATMVAFAIASPAAATDENPDGECDEELLLEHSFDSTTGSGWVQHMGDNDPCVPVYVHAATWAFVNTEQGDSIWPQTLSGVNTLAVSGTEKVYFQAPGPLECAQIDIYYTENENPALPAEMGASGDSSEPAFLHDVSDGPTPSWVVFGGSSGPSGTLTQDCGDSPPLPLPEEPTLPSVDASVTYVCDAAGTVNLSSVGGLSDFVVTANGAVVFDGAVDGTNPVDVTVEGTTSVVVMVDGIEVLNEIVVFEACDDSGVGGIGDEVDGETEVGTDTEAGVEAGTDTEAEAGVEAGTDTDVGSDVESESRVGGIGEEVASAGSETLPRTGGSALVTGLAAITMALLGATLVAFERRGFQLAGRRRR